MMVKIKSMTLDMLSSILMCATYESIYDHIDRCIREV